MNQIKRGWFPTHIVENIIVSTNVSLNYPLVRFHKKKLYEFFTVCFSDGYATFQPPPQMGHHDVLSKNSKTIKIQSILSR